MLILFAVSVALVMLHSALFLCGVKGVNHDKNKSESESRKAEDEQG